MGNWKTRIEVKIQGRANKFIHSASESKKYRTYHNKIDIVHVLGSISMCTLEIVYDHINASIAALPAGVGVGAEEECYLLCPCYHAGEGEDHMAFNVDLMGYGNF